jgi:hypothetical protein
MHRSGTGKNWAYTNLILPSLTQNGSKVAIMGLTTDSSFTAALF